MKFLFALTIAYFLGTGLLLRADDPAAPSLTKAVVGNWGTPSDPDQLAHFAATPDGRLTIEVGDGQVAADFNADYKSNAPCLLTEVDSDFVVEVLVDPIALGGGAGLKPRTAPKTGAGLAVLIDRNTYIRLDETAVKTEGNQDLHELVFDCWEGKIRKVKTDLAAVEWDPAKPLRLWLQRKGPRLFASISQDQNHWQELYLMSIWRWPAKVQVGVFALNTGSNEFAAHLSDFKLTASPMSAAAPNELRLPGRERPLLAKLEPRNALRGGWGIRVDPEGIGAFKVQDHELSVEMPGIGADYSFASGSFNAPRALVEVDGDFVFQALVQPPPLPQGYPTLTSPENTNTNMSLWSSAGLIAVADDETFSRFDTGISNDRGNPRRKLIYDLQHDKREENFERSLPWEPEKPIWLRYERRGNILRGAHSSDGREWYYHPRLDISGWPKKIRLGIDVCQTASEPYVARFSDRTLVNSSLPRDAIPLAPLDASSSESAPTWGKAVNPAHTATITSSENTLTMALTSADSDLDQTHISAPRVLTELSGDFSMQVRVDPPNLADLAGKWRSAGLILVVNDRNYFRFDRGVWKDPDKRTKPTILCKYVLQSLDEYVYDDSKLDWDPNAPLWLRLERHGDRVQAAVSEDGTKWTELTSQDLSEWPTRLYAGIFAVNTSGTPTSFQFHDFSLKSGEKPVDQPTP